MKHYRPLILGILCSLGSSALAQTNQDEKESSGFKPKATINVISHLNYSATEKSGKVSNSFNHVRTYGYFILDLNSKIQTTFLFMANPDDRQYMHEAFLSYNMRKEFKIFGGLKRSPITMLNQMSPTAYETASTPEIISQIVGGDVDISKGTNSGRDLGLELQGELFPANDSYSFLEYYVGVFNGVGVSSAKDNNNGKDFVGRLVGQPIKNLKFTAGWLIGQRGNKETDTVLPMRKMISGGISYNIHKFSTRAEYIWANHAPTKKHGGYWMAQYAFNSKWSLTGQFETYKNERISMANVENYNYILTANYWFYKRCRLQFQIAHKRESGTPINTAMTQLQIVF